MVNKPTHISGSSIDHIYIKKSLMENIFTNGTVENIYYSGDDAAIVIFDKNAIVFCTIC